MLLLAFLVLSDYKTGEGGIAVVGYESADVSDKQNFKHCLKFMLDFLISFQGFRSKRKII